MRDPLRIAAQRYCLRDLRTNGNGAIGKYHLNNFRQLAVPTMQSRQRSGFHGIVLSLQTRPLIMFKSSQGFTSS